MLSRLAILLLSILIPLATLAGCDSRAAQVKATDDALDRAIDSRNGHVAAAYLSKDSLALLDRLVAAARTESKKKVQVRTTSEQVYILTARLMFTPAELKKATGRDFYVKRVDKGWAMSGATLQREKVAVMKDRAVITYWDPESEFRSRWHYVLEDGAWKMDVVTMIEEYDREDRQLAREHDMTPEQLVMTFVAQLTQMDEIPDSVWSPPK